MRFSQLPIGSAGRSDAQRMQAASKLAVICWCVLLILLLAACGSSPTASNQNPPAPTATLLPTSTNAPTPTAAPTLPPTPKLTPPPTPILAPTPPPPPAASILDVAPASMSIVGHFDCIRTATVFICQAAVISRARNQATLHWAAFANFGKVGFAPAVGNLAPGTRIILTIRIPVNECAGTFFFQGPVNTHTISWQC
jgi:hypothetical protein